MQRIFSLFSVAVLCPLLASATDYNIRSLEGQSRKITFIYSANAAEDVTISYQKSMIHIPNVTSVDTVAVVKGQFLKVVYTGNENTQWVMLTSIRQDKLYECAQFTLRGKMGEGKGPEYKWHTLKQQYTFMGDGTNSYKLDMSNFLNEGNSEMAFEGFGINKFNTTLNVFMDSMLHLQGNFTVYTPDGKESSSYIDVNTPQFSQAIGRYCYWNGCWYSFDAHQKSLVALSSR